MSDEPGRDEFAAAFAEATNNDPRLGAVGAVCCTARSVRPCPSAAAAASLWPMVMRCAQINPDGVARAGFGTGPDAGNRLFDAIVDIRQVSCSPTTPGRRRGNGSRPTMGSSTSRSPTARRTRRSCQRHPAGRRSALADAAVGR